MSAQETRVRKSNRQPVPNPIYQQGITDLKNENTNRPKRKAKNDEENPSYDEDRNSINQIKDQYVPCRLPNGTLIKVKFVVESKREQKKKQKQMIVTLPVSKPVVQPTVSQKKPPTTNLLSIFIQAIDNAAVGGQISPQPTNPLKQNPTQTQKQKPMPPRHKRNRLQQQQFIKKVTIQNGVMKLQHSQLNELTYEIDWKQTQMKEEEKPEIEEMRRKLENSKIIKNISIFTTGE